LLLFTRNCATDDAGAFHIRGTLASDGLHFERIHPGADVRLDWTVLTTPIMRVERGVASWSGSEGVVALSAPFPAGKSFALASFTHGGTDSGTDDLMEVAFLDDKTLHFVTGSAGGGLVTWQAVELTDASTVHSGYATLDSSSTTASVSIPEAVDPSRSFLL